MICEQRSPQGPDSNVWLNIRVSIKTVLRRVRAPRAGARARAPNVYDGRRAGAPIRRTPTTDGTLLFATINETCLSIKWKDCCKLLTLTGVRVASDNLH